MRRIEWLTSCKDRIPEGAALAIKLAAELAAELTPELIAENDQLGRQRALRVSGPDSSGARRF